MPTRRTGRPWHRRQRHLPGHHRYPHYSQHPDVTADWIRDFIQHIDGAPASGPLQRSEVTGKQLKGPDSGKRVVITGAGSGIGRETALAFARRGALVVCTDINTEAAAA
ncbi:MAG: SDR family NAD(P)-dependent oxidoreductase, partial [Delftia sp.]|nr:SDR family NAD(P)-dependent oxidoreductase [Delftia sp.]